MVFLSRSESVTCYNWNQSTALDYYSRVPMITTLHVPAEIVGIVSSSLTWVLLSQDLSLQVPTGRTSCCLGFCLETAGGGPYPVGTGRARALSGPGGPRTGHIWSYQVRTDRARAPSSWDQDRPGARGPPPRQPFCFNYAEKFVILRDPYCGYKEMT
jgi:hypothetical protein